MRLPLIFPDGRVHHKFSETDADPHNAKRGFFFSHVGWLLVRKHPQVTTMMMVVMMMMMMVLMMMMMTMMMMIR